MNTFPPPGMTMPSFSSQVSRASEIEAPGESRVAALLLARYNLRYLVRLYSAFDGDLLLPIVLGEVGLYNVGGLVSTRTPWRRCAATATPSTGCRCAPATRSRSARPPASPARRCAAR